MNVTNADRIEHERFCLPRPGETEPRVESYAVDRYSADGVTVVSRPTLTRCIECGAQVVEG